MRSSGILFDRSCQDVGTFPKVPILRDRNCITFGSNGAPGTVGSLFAVGSLSDIFFSGFVGGRDVLMAPCGTFFGVVKKPLSSFSDFSVFS